MWLLIFCVWNCVARCKFRTAFTVSTECHHQFKTGANNHGLFVDSNVFISQQFSQQYFQTSEQAECQVMIFGWSLPSNP